MINQKRNEYCLILIKPEAMLKCIAGNVISEIDKINLKLIGAKLVKVSKNLAKEHYKEHKDKPFFKKLIRHITGKFHKNENVLALVYSGKNAIRKLRELAGSTNPTEAKNGTIRQKYGKINPQTGCYENVVHVSDSKISSEKEIKLWFSPEELIENIFPSKKISAKVKKWS